LHNLDVGGVKDDTSTAVLEDTGNVCQGGWCKGLNVQVVENPWLLANLGLTGSISSMVAEFDR